MDRPANTLNTADNSGITAATIEPNMNNSSTRAHDTPMISDFLSSVVSAICPAAPPYSTSSPADLAGATASLSCLRYALSSVCVTTSQFTVPYAVVPFLATCGEFGTANGLTAL